LRKQNRSKIYAVEAPAVDTPGTDSPTSAVKDSVATTTANNGQPAENLASTAESTKRPGS